MNHLGIIRFLVALLPLAGCQKAPAKDEKRSGIASVPSASPSPQPVLATTQPTAATPAATHKVTFAGTVALDTHVSDSDLDNLTPGGAVPGATVFLKDSPANAVKADANGAFTIDLVLPASASGLDDPLAGSIYEVVIWYTTPTAKNRFGIQKSAVAEPDQPVDLGEVQLSYTRKAAFTLTDASGTAIPNYADGSTCSVVFPGYEGKITVSAAAGALTGSYIPPSTYQVTVTCAGYKTLTSMVTIEAATTFANVQAIRLALAAN